MGQQTIFIYQIGFTRTNQYGDQLFTIAINEKIKHYTFPEGDHVDVEAFIEDIRLRLNARLVG